MVLGEQHFLLAQFSEPGIQCVVLSRPLLSVLGLEDIDGSRNSANCLRSTLVLSSAPVVGWPQ